MRALAVIAAVTLVAAGCSSTGQDQADRKGQTGFVTGDGTLTVIAPDKREQAPALTGQTLDEKPWSSADHAGKVIVLNVWGSWCGPCREEAADLEKAAQELGSGVVFVGLNTRDLDPAPAKRFVDRFKISYPSIYDPKGQQLLKFRGQIALSAVPSTLVIDKQGKAAARVTGKVTSATLVDVVRDVDG